MKLLLVLLNLDLLWLFQISFTVMGNSVSEAAGGRALSKNISASGGLLNMYLCIQGLLLQPGLGKSKPEAVGSSHQKRNIRCCPFGTFCSRITWQMVCLPEKLPFCLALLCLAQVVAGWGRAVHSQFAFPPAREAEVAGLKPEVTLCLSFSNHFLSSFLSPCSKKTKTKTTTKPKWPPPKKILQDW